MIVLQPRHARVSLRDYVELNVGGMSREMVACQVGVRSVVFGIEQTHSSIHALRLRRPGAATCVVVTPIVYAHDVAPLPRRRQRSYITCVTTFFDRHIVREATTVELVRLSLSRLNAFKAEVTTPHRAAAPASTMIPSTPRAT